MRLGLVTHKPLTINNISDIVEGSSSTSPCKNNVKVKKGDLL